MKGFQPINKPQLSATGYLISSKPKVKEMSAYSKSQHGVKL